MIDTSTQKPLTVLSAGTAGPYIMVPLSQLSEVRQLLDEQHVRYSVTENAVSLYEAPLVALIDLDQRANVTVVQDILDSAL